MGGVYAWDLWDSWDLCDGDLIGLMCPIGPIRRIGPARPDFRRVAHSPCRYFITPVSVRRFLAQAASLWPESAGISIPKLTV
jgi:hypothetical protein